METILLKITAAILAASTTLSTSAAALEDRIIHTGSMAVTVIDYGLAGMNGDAVLLSSAGANLLMDTGYWDADSPGAAQPPVPVYDAYGNLLYEEPADPLPAPVITWLKEHKVQQLDLYLSHWHNDHYYLLTAIMEDDSFKVGKIYLPEISEERTYADPSHAGETWYNNLLWNIPGAEASRGPHSYSAIVETAERRGVEIVWLDEGSQFEVGDARAEVLWHRKANFPYGQTVVPYLNDRSLVTMITCGGVRYLTCGDLHDENERAILDAGVDVRADIFKANHHAKDTSNCEEWLDAVAPSWILSTRYKLDDGTDPTPEDSVEDRLRARGTFLSVRDLGTFTVHADNGVITAEGEGFTIGDNKPHVY